MASIDKKIATIDVIIPIYNKVIYLERALDSVLAQTYPVNKIIVVDDGSTDDVLGAVTDYQSKNGRQIIYLHQENSGPGSARNLGLTVSTSEYVSFLDSDDEILPNLLEEQMAVFDNNSSKDLAMVYSLMSYIDTEGRMIKKGDLPEKMTEEGLWIKGWVFDKLSEMNYIFAGGSSSLLKRSCLDRVGVFDVSLQANEDWDLWLRLARYYQIDVVPKRLVLYRQHSESITKNTGLMFLHKLRFYEKWSSDQDAGCLSEIWSLRGSQLSREIFWNFLNRIIGGGSGPSFYKIAVDNLSSQAKKKIFHATNGIILPHVILSIIGQAGRVLALLAKSPKRLLSIIRNKL